MSDVSTIKPRIRAYLLSCTDHKEPLSTFEYNYAKMYKKIDLKEFGHTSLLKFMQSIPDVVRIVSENGTMMLVGISTKDTSHIVNMIDKQKKPKKAKGNKRGFKDSMIFPRFQGSGSRPPPYRPMSGGNFNHHVPRNAIFPHATSRMQPHAKRNFPPQPPRRSAPPAPSRPLAPVNSSPSKPYRPVKVSPPSKPTSEVRQQPRPSPSTSASVPRVSVHQRLGPPPNQASSDTRHVMMSNNQPRKIEVTQEPQPVRKSPSPPPPVSNENQQPINTAVVEVTSADSETSEPSVDELAERLAGQFLFAEDEEFLRLIVRYVLASLDDAHRNVFTPSGIASRMRRKLARVHIGVPQFAGDVILGYIQSSWNDSFVRCSASSEDLDSTSEFTFAEPLKSAYNSPLVKLPHQPYMRKNETHRVKVIHIDSPAFYVTVCSDVSSQEYDDLDRLLRDEVDMDDTITYRVNELCAVELSDKFARGQLMNFSIKSSQLDLSNCQLSLMAVVFLVDTGETVLVPALSVYALPSRCRDLPARAYRCVFYGGRVDNAEQFSTVMASHMNKELDLQVFGVQKSEKGLVLQVRIFASSYVSDDLARDNIMSRVTISEPEARSWPKSLPVRFIDWHAGYRSVLVQRRAAAELKELETLEEKLSHAVAEENGGVLQPLLNNLYIWQNEQGRCRRVRCLAVPQAGDDKQPLVMCLDHGCRCRVSSPRQLFLPQRPEVNALFSGHPYLTASIRLAMLPDEMSPSADDIMMHKPLRQKLRRLCLPNTDLVAINDREVSEKHPFILRVSDQGENNDGFRMGCKPSLNMRFLSLYMDMSHWKEGQRFTANLFRPQGNIFKFPSSDMQPWIIRFDSDGCSPSFEKPVHEFRYMEVCCLEYTYAASDTSDTVMQRLPDLPPQVVVEPDTIILYREDTREESSHVVRVRLMRAYTTAHHGEVEVILVDNPVSQAFSVLPDLLFTVPPEGFGNRPLLRKCIDADDRDFDHFRDLLQNLPPLDQVVISMDQSVAEKLDRDADRDGDIPIELTIGWFTEIHQRRFPVVCVSGDDKIKNHELRSE